MNVLRKSIFSICTLLTCFSLTNCSSDDNGKGSTTDLSGIENSYPLDSTANFNNADEVRIWVLSDVESLNPIVTSDASNTEMCYYTHHSLMMLDPFSNDLLPVLATGEPIIEEKDGKVNYTFTIRPEATWDDGKPITGHDYAFSIKSIFNPQVIKSGHLRPYYDYVEDVIVNPSNQKEFTVVTSRPYMTAANTLADIWILPKHIYDSKGLMDKFTIKQLVTGEGYDKNDPALKAFQKDFEGEKFLRNEHIGSGPYQFAKWVTNQYVELERKKDWWGDKVKAEGNAYFQAEPNKIKFMTIKEPNTAIAALKSEELDAMQKIEPREFVEELQTNAQFQGKYTLSTPPSYAYDYIGLNMRKPIFQDVKVRKAMAHLMNVDQLIKSQCYGLGERVNGVIHPKITERLNTALVPYAFDVNKAKKLLEEAGWKDTDGDRVLDKTIDGKKEKLEFTIMFNQGNKRRENACIIFQSIAKAAGVNINVKSEEWAVFLDKLDKHDFESYVGGWVSSPLESDPAQIWHTSSYNGGSNYIGFGDETTDALIDKLRVTLDKNERNNLWKELQKVHNEQVPYIFLMAQENRVAIHRKYGDHKGSHLRSGMYSGSFGQRLTQ